MAETSEARLSALAHAFEAASHPLALDDALERIVRVMEVDAGALRVVQGEDLVLKSARGVEAQAAPLRIRIGEGTAGAAAQRRAPVVVTDVEHSDLDEPWATYGIRAVVAVPLMDGPRLVGALKLGCRAVRDFGPDVELLRGVAKWLAVAIERAREQDLHARSLAGERLRADFSVAVGAAVEDFERTVALIAERVADHIGDLCAVWLLSDNGEWLDNVAVHAADPAHVEHVRPIVQARRRTDSEHVGAVVVRQRRTLFVPMAERASGLTSAEQEAVGRAAGVTGVIVCPLVAHGAVIGTLDIARFGHHGPAYGDSDRKLLEALAVPAGAAVQAARALRHARATGAELQLADELVRGAAHDLSNLLMVIRGYGEIVQRRLAGTPEAADVDSIVVAAEKANELMGQLASRARRREPRFEPLDLNVVVDELVPLLRRLAPEGIDISAVPGEPPGPVLADRGLLEQLLLNLVAATRAGVRSGGTISIATAGQRAGADVHARLTVSSSGAAGGPWLEAAADLAAQLNGSVTGVWEPAAELDVHLPTVGAGAEPGT